MQSDGLAAKTARGSAVPRRRKTHDKYRKLARGDMEQRRQRRLQAGVCRRHVAT